jgi:hypothetical protein
MKITTLNYIPFFMLYGVLFMMCMEGLTELGIPLILWGLIMFLIYTAEKKLVIHRSHLNGDEMPELSIEESLKLGEYHHVFGKAVRRIVWGCYMLSVPLFQIIMFLPVCIRKQHNEILKEEIVGTEYTVGLIEEDSSIDSSKSFINYFVEYHIFSTWYVLEIFQIFTYLVIPPNPPPLEIFVIPETVNI